MEKDLTHKFILFSFFLGVFDLKLTHNVWNQIVYIHIAY